VPGKGARSPILKSGRKPRRIVEATGSNSPQSCVHRIAFPTAGNWRTAGGAKAAGQSVAGFRRDGMEFLLCPFESDPIACNQQRRACRAATGALAVPTMADQLSNGLFGALVSDGAACTSAGELILHLGTLTFRRTATEWSLPLIGTTRPAGLERCSHLFARSISGEALRSTSTTAFYERNQSWKSRWPEVFLRSTPAHPGATSP
jgi:hypothetical protein